MQNQVVVRMQIELVVAVGVARRNCCKFAGHHRLEQALGFVEEVLQTQYPSSCSTQTATAAEVPAQEALEREYRKSQSSSLRAE